MLRKAWRCFKQDGYVDEDLSPEIFLKFSISSFLAASQRAIVFESEKKKKYCYFLSLTLSGIDKSIKAL